MRRKPMSAHSRQDIAFFDAGDADVLMRFGLPGEAPAVAVQNFGSHFGRESDTRDTYPTSVPDVSRCRGVDHAEHCLEMANGRYFSALLCLFNHPIAHRFAEPLGGWNRSPWV